MKNGSYALTLSHENVLYCDKSASVLIDLHLLYGGLARQQVKKVLKIDGVQASWVKKSESAFLASRKILSPSFQQVVHNRKAMPEILTAEDFHDPDESGCFRFFGSCCAR